MGRKRGKSNKYFGYNGYDIEAEKRYWDTERDKLDFGKIEPEESYSELDMEKEKIDMRNKLRMYTVVKKHIASVVVDGSREGLDITNGLVEESNILGKGYYVYSNLNYARKKAAIKGKEYVVIGILIDLDRCVDLTTSEFNGRIKKVHKLLSEKKEKVADGDIIDKLCKDMKAYSIKYARVGDNRLYKESRLYDNVSLIVCIKNTKVIKRCYRVVNK